MWIITEIKSCPILTLMSTLWSRWVLMIFNAIAEENYGFNEIKRALPWVSARVLSERLWELETNGFIVRDIIETKPLKVRYSFTKEWQELWLKIEAMNEWAISNKSFLLGN